MTPIRMGNIIGLAIACAPATTARAQTCPAPHALVLSGGGAKGYAHVGVLQVFDSLGLRPDRIVGTSMGSIVGALYASGYSAHEVDSIMRGVDASSLLRATEPVAPRVFGALNPVLYWEQGRGGLGIMSISTLDTRLNAALNDMLLNGNLAAGGDFGRLPIPLTAVAAALTTRELVLLQRGDLAHAVRASMSLPLAFYPQRLGGRILVDGSVADNTPVGPARLGGARSLTVVNVSDVAADTVDINSVTAIAEHLFDLFMTESTDSLGASDIGIRPDIRGLRTLDFSAERLALAVRRGRAAAESTLATARCLPPRGHPPGAPGGPFRLVGLTVTAPRNADARFIRRAFGLTVGDTLDLARIRRAYRAMAYSPERREIWLNPRRDTTGLSLDVTMTPPPHRAAGIAIALDFDQGGRIGAIVVDHTLLGGPLQMVGGLSLNRYQQTVLLGIGPEPVSFSPIAPVLQLRGLAEDVRIYDSSGVAQPFVPTSDGYALVGLEKAQGPWLLQAGPFFHTWHVTGSGGRTFGVRLRFTRGTPARLPFVLLDAATAERWSRVTAEGSGALHHGSWTLGGAARAGTSGRVPIQLLLPLAGARGFPGYQVFELRGTGELFGELSALRTVTGPLSAGAELAAGRSPGSLHDAWLGGARLVAELDTPLGALRGGYGWATSGRRAVFARLGTWF
jgi:predicted acylesterase/phospholipase RssA